MGIDSLSGSLDWSSFTDFALLITNNNENAWDFSVTIEDGATGGVATETTGFSSLAVGDSMLFTIALSGSSLDLTDIDRVFLTVRGDLPLGTAGNPDRTAEYRVQSTVPVPASVWLFGSAIGMLGWVRRRMNRAAVPA